MMRDSRQRISALSGAAADWATASIGAAMAMQDINKLRYSMGEALYYVDLSMRG
jgi:hypothetical protein